jgi:multiple sugar transport system permease protein
LFCLVALSAWALFPLYWALALSIKRPLDFFNGTLIPFLSFPPTLDSWHDEIVYFVDEYGKLSLGRGLFNSALIGLGSAALALLLGTPAGYGLARLALPRRLRRAAVLAFLLPRFVLPVATAIPLYLLFRALHLLDTHLGLILVNSDLVLPFVVLLVRDAVAALPDELLEAAYLDGCSAASALWQVALPLLAPTLLAAGVLAFALTWNEFFLGYVLAAQNAQTMPMVVASLDTKDGIMLEYTGSHLVLAVLPPVVLLLTIQRVLARALSFGSVRGGTGSGT